MRPSPSLARAEPAAASSLHSVAAASKSRRSKACAPVSPPVSAAAVSPAVWAGAGGAGSAIARTPATRAPNRAGRVTAR